MQALTDAEDITSIDGVPERGRMAKMRLRGKEEFESDVCG